MSRPQAPPLGLRHESPPAPAGPGAGGVPLRLVLLAGFGALVASLLTLMQLRVIGSWDPVFGAASTDAVLHSNFSRALPVPDALLGALAYAAETGLGLAASPGRTRVHPWIPAVFEALALATAAGGLALVAVQALVVHHWCSLCLLSTLVSLAVVVLAGPSRIRDAWQVARDLAH